MFGEELRALESSSRQTPLSFSSSSSAAPLLPAQKIALFSICLAPGAPSIQVMGELKTAKKGYAPACHNEWRPGVCRKPQIKCTDCAHQKFPPLDANAIEAHLRGRNHRNLCHP